MPYYKQSYRAMRSYNRQKAIRAHKTADQAVSVIYVRSARALKTVDAIRNADEIVRAEEADRILDVAANLHQELAIYVSDLEGIVLTKAESKQMADALRKLREEIDRAEKGLEIEDAFEVSNLRLVMRTIKNFAGKLALRNRLKRIFNITSRLHDALVQAESDLTNWFELGSDLMLIDLETTPLSPPRIALLHELSTTLRRITADLDDYTAIIDSLKFEYRRGDKLAKQAEKLVSRLGFIARMVDGELPPSPEQYNKNILKPMADMTYKVGIESDRIEEVLNRGAVQHDYLLTLFK